MNELYEEVALAISSLVKDLGYVVIDGREYDMINENSLPNKHIVYSLLNIQDVGARYVENTYDGVNLEVLRKETSLYNCELHIDIYQDGLNSSNIADTIARHLNHKFFREKKLKSFNILDQPIIRPFSSRLGGKDYIFTKVYLNCVFALDLTLSVESIETVEREIKIGGNK